MAYLYRHIRLDKNEPFYIGIGSDDGGQYERAYSKDSRTLYWRNIVKKTEYEVEVMLDDLTWEEACDKEREFIKLYGRKDLNEGILINMTNGGQGTPGYKHSDNTKKKCRESAKTQKSNIKGTIEYDKARFLRSDKLKGEGNPCYGKFGKEHPAFGYEGYWTGRCNHPRKSKVEYEGITYTSKTELAKHLKVSKALITKMIKKQKVKELINS